MTTLEDTEVTCAICAKKSKHTTVGSTNAFGAPDLDLRPPEMERSTMEFWLQECPSCGYVSYEIDEAHSEAKSAMETEEFKAIQSGPVNTLK